MMFALSSCGENAVILDNSDKSYFVDFYTGEDKVYIECVLNVVNISSSEKTVEITAYDKEDVEIGLLTNPTLVAYEKSTDNNKFTLAPGENEISVVFVGEYAGIYQITSRDLPRFIEIKQ